MARRQGRTTSKAVSGMEATGSYWIALAWALHTAGFVMAIINPAQAHYFAKALLNRAKSDALDAQTLAHLG